uniref:Cytochrome b6-f complex subunit 6 n=1 Tax=Koliella longiseta TaxID=33092 RepID=A0A097KLD1_9CHLO|nr:subunit VI of cytochrome b6/f complex [Koliella longiseta]AIT93982.1 subunit VI of cytochrome b6/f complex [Koliella longiseta]
MITIISYIGLLTCVLGVTLFVYVSLLKIKLI